MPKLATGRAGGLCLKQSIFNWAAKVKYTALKQFKLGEINIFLTKHYDISDTERVKIIKNCLGREHLPLTQTPKCVEQELNKTIAGLFKILIANF